MPIFCNEKNYISEYRISSIKQGGGLTNFNKRVDVLEGELIEEGTCLIFQVNKVLMELS